ncbi:large conductance mechanosensitive channel protein [Candidatus Nitrososphaera evergladensis SR1]|jgi:large conductance mechanosensitive channel|uniref:Large conductance mechanosensitive channel protein n=1 Tax=Candidatus Nitrososphaera evergladensis SR1 TaxID=1459636 RepID=A0A075MPQ3_9ARCH|nr:large conductance mechanosensitive channel protein MscL [Candidatus Nitrososphaera evergladensis]AIF83541.1 large conductance mechanosensitive channel protein [Candidatus Nitrososphaera evergladensis SR1]
MSDSNSSAAPPPEKKSLMTEFIIFLRTFGVIGLAIAFVIGAAASKLVTAFVNDIVTPIVGLALPSGDLKTMAYNVTNSVTGATTTFSYGDLISNIIDFLIIAFIVFLMYKLLSRYKVFGVEDKTKPAPPK